MHRINYLEDIEGARKLARWHARPWSFRLRYRYNVVRGLVLRQITFKSCWDALEHSYTVVVVPMRPPRRGMLIVCPEFADEYFQMSKPAPAQGCDGDGHDPR